MKFLLAITFLPLTVIACDTDPKPLTEWDPQYAGTASWSDDGERILRNNFDYEARLVERDLGPVEEWRNEQTTLDILDTSGATISQSAPMPAGLEAYYMRSAGYVLLAPSVDGDAQLLRIADDEFLATESIALRDVQPASVAEGEWTVLPSFDGQWLAVMYSGLIAGTAEVTIIASDNLSVVMPTKSVAFDYILNASFWTTDGYLVLPNGDDTQWAITPGTEPEQMPQQYDFCRRTAASSGNQQGQYVYVDDETREVYVSAANAQRDCVLGEQE